MNSRVRTALMYVMKSGRIPFEEWLRGLKDINTRAIIQARIRRLELGNVGVYRFLGRGVFELKIFLGPGYRVYFGEDGLSWVILLCGGDKGRQKNDIQKAQEYWDDYRRRK